MSRFYLLILPSPKGSSFEVLGDIYLNSPNFIDKLDKCPKINLSIIIYFVPKKLLNGIRRKLWSSSGYFI